MKYEYDLPYDLQDVTFIAGARQYLVFSAFKFNSTEPCDLDGCSAVFEISKYSTVDGEIELSKQMAVIDSPDGQDELTVQLLYDDTKGMLGSYRYTISVTDSGGQKEKRTGRMEIFPDTFGSANLFSKQIVIPRGRMRGDVNGDGNITEADSQMMTSLISGSTPAGYDPTDAEQVASADLDGDGHIYPMDAISVMREVAYTNRDQGSCPDNMNYRYGGYEEVTGNWTRNPDCVTEEAQFYTDISMSDTIVGREYSIFGSRAGFITSVVGVSGNKVRVFVSKPPIEETEVTIGTLS